MRTLVGLFDEGTAAGVTMRFLFETVFQPIIDQARNAAYAVEAFALGFLIGLTKVYIAIKPAIKAIVEFFGFDDTSLESVLALVTKAGEYAAYIFVGFVATLGALAAAVGLVIAGLFALSAAAVAMAVAFHRLVMAVAEAISGAIGGAIDFLKGLDLAEIGRDLIGGLVRGLIGAGPEVLSALGGVVKGAISSAKALLGISSPSKVFAGIGENTAEGFAQGVDSGAGDAGAALDRLIETPLSKQDALSGNVGAAAPATPAAPPASSGGTSIAGATFNFYGVEGAEQAVSRFEEALTRALEGDATALGGANA
jgi:hypothetical protein